MAEDMMYRRFAAQRVGIALEDTPVVLIVGPRQSGKTTLVQAMQADGRTYITLDDQAALSAATADPTGFIRGLDRAIIDEVQRAPELLLAIKRSVDEDRRPGRFLLTGSANVITLPRVADSLAGRMETIRLLPLTQAEIEGRTPRFLQDLFDGKLRPHPNALVGDDLIRLALRGGFPELINRRTERRRRDWADAYLQSVLTRDLRDIADVERQADLSRFVKLLAEHSGQLVNYSQLGAGIGVTHPTGRRYLGLLEKMYLIETLQPWFINGAKRIVKTPKLHFLDSGLLASVRNLAFARVQADPVAFGPLLESFVYAEILKLMATSDQWLTPYHFRNREQREVDIVLERDDGMIAGIEVKASATVRHKDFAGLRTLAEASGKRFAFGVVLYDSANIVPVGERLMAAPLSCLWH